MAAPSAQSFDQRQLLHPRGFCISAGFTCAVCGKMLQALRLNIRDGVQKCSTCGALFKVGISLYLLPQGAIRSQYLAPDESTPGVERTAIGLRARSRKARQATLRSVGLDDPAPLIACKGAQRGLPINSVIVVPEPTP